jgi:16S rRNA (guanine527-N7)-methyltransferase
MRKQFSEKLWGELEKGALALHVKMPESSLAKLMCFMEILLKWNKIHNLTAIDCPEDIITRHFLDSLSIAPYIQGKTILDMGSGAGFPGIPCALALSDKQFTLLDSNEKKIRFLTQVIGELQLKNVSIVQQRIEKFKPTCCFDTIMVRAFSKLSKIIACTQSLICLDGVLLAMKGIYPQEELQNINYPFRVYRLMVPGLKEKRHLVYINGLRMTKDHKEHQSIQR